MDQISKYFNAEKQESLVFVGVGLVSAMLSIYFLWKIKQPFYNGMALSLLVIAFIQLVVGTTVYFRSPKDVERVEQILRSNRSGIQSEEIPRMEKVMKNFALYRWIEIVLIICGIFFYFYFPSGDYLKGVGLGLFTQAGLMLAFDFIAESRAKMYLKFLEDLR